MSRMSLMSRLMSLFTRRPAALPVDGWFAPGQSPWRDALIDEGLDARSFPVIRAERETSPLGELVVDASSPPPRRSAP